MTDRTKKNLTAAVGRDASMPLVEAALQTLTRSSGQPDIWACRNHRQLDAPSG